MKRFLQQKLFVTGTDTDVGKTVFSTLLMQYFFNNGFVPFYLKPFQTGCKDPYDSDSDAKFVYQNVAELKGKDPADSVLFCFSNPKAPLFATRDDNGVIEPDLVLKCIEAKSAYHSPIVLEAAGGLLVPVTEDLMMIDVIKSAGAAAIIVARAGLGTINHTLMTVETLRSRKIDPLGIVFMNREKTPDDLIEENIEAVEKNSGVNVGCVIGEIDDFSNSPEGFCQPIDNLFNDNYKDCT